jgi:hypothetical protein
MSTSREGIYREISLEREKQDRLWGGADHDRMHSSHDWIAYITKHVGRAVFWPWTPEKFKAEMIVVAALAVAACEWVADPKNSRVPKAEEHQHGV